jgi:hypothetical protein
VEGPPRIEASGMLSLCQVPWCSQPVPRRICFTVVVFAVLALPPVRAQESHPGPLNPPPEHEVHRISTEGKPEAPPPVPPTEIIRRFSSKEDEFLATRARFGFRKSIRVEEFGEDGKVSGQFQMSTVPTVASDGKVYEKIVELPRSTLHTLRLAPEDLATLAQIPLFPLTTAQLTHYELTYSGKEQVDELNCYVFRVKPKVVERTHAFFEGIVWVDDQELEVVRTYGKWVTDLGDYHSPELPFTLFDTYRENVQGKYWFPAYARSDDAVQLKDHEVRVRLVVLWKDYSPSTAAGAAAAPAPAASPAAASTPSPQTAPH